MFRIRPLVSSPLRVALYQTRSPLTARQIAATRFNIAAMSTISDVITKDHRELEQYYNEVVNSSDHDHQERYGNQFTWELARHSVAEELIVYPAFEKYMGGKGHQMAESDRKDHHRVKELLKEFQNMKPQQQDYVPKLKELWGVLSAHMEEEEKHDMPALESALQSAAGESETATMAKKFGLTKAFVPSRSHPSAGENPYFESAMGMLAAPIDHIADIFRKFPEEKVSPNPSTK
ncbi:DNA nickase [Chaetomidium leptoderma]|uniref:DNA nickase n=1 Tax=Chaetomidium leptoderma TaxID=669021 RepID=A0AAN6ZWH2_9PEZI|nr:DNA nickase [Chaetomidium leptoderma]